MVNIGFRVERPEDYRQTEELTREAFWNRYVPGCDEHYLLHIMRDSPQFVKDLDFIATIDNKIVGIAVCLRSFIITDSGQRYDDVLSMGPLAVLPSCQGLGIGKALTLHTRCIAAQLGYRAILLSGEPRYYPKLGFTPAEQFNIRTSENKYSAALHAYPLYPNALIHASGKYYEPPIYTLDAKQAQAFDKTFPPKERITGTLTQKRFKEVVAMQRDYIPTRN